ncbi:MAG: glycosyltransferase family 39 protein [Candidatus Micrarchaeia archaeon]|jgi:4-amino-4-deoxy-L-arabinose transferase-like glycosyltransferase
MEQTADAPAPAHAASAEAGKPLVYGLSLAGLFALVLAAFTFYNAFSYSHNVLWWDEAEYALLAQNVYANGQYEYWPGFQGWLIPSGSHRPPLLPLATAGLYELFGKSEAMLRGVVPFFSALGVLAVFLVGRRLFNEWAGAIAAALLSFSTLFWFYSSRVLTEAPLVFFSAMLFYLFYRTFEEKNWRFLPLLGVFAALGFLMKYTILAIFLPIGLFVLIYYYKGILQALRSKDFLASAGVSVLVAVALVAPVFAFSASHAGTPLAAMQKYLEATSGSEPAHYYLTIIAHMFSNTGVVLLVILGIGLALAYGDKKGTQLSVLLILALLVLSLAISHKEDRYAMLIYPFAYGLAGFAAFKALAGVSKLKAAPNESSVFAVGFALAMVPLLYVGTIGNVGNAQMLVNAKITSYQEVATAGQYVAANTAPEDWVIADSFFMASYYSGRRSELLPATAAEFGKMLDARNPKYVWFSAFQHGYPQLQEAAQAQQGNQNAPDTPGGYVLSHQTEFALEQVFKDPQGQPMVFLFRRTA